MGINKKKKNEKSNKTNDVEDNTGFRRVLFGPK